LIRDMYAFRAVVERHVAETLASRPDFDSSSLRQVLESGRKAIAAGDVNRAIELDLRFHTMLYDSVGNQVLSSVMHSQWAHIRRVMAVTLTLPRLRERVWDEHATILDAIDAHDSRRAAAEAEAHMNAASSTLLEQMGTAAAAEIETPSPKTTAARKSARGRAGKRKIAKPRPTGRRLASSR
jgi:DNA-binding GntR family transcriptional regulator